MLAGIRSLNKPEHLELAIRAANAGSTTARIMLSNFYEKGQRNAPPNYKKSFEWLLKAANGGISNSAGQRQIDSNFLLLAMNVNRRIDARLRLAIYYLGGHGVRADRSTAKAWVRRAAEDKFLDVKRLFPSFFKEKIGAKALSKAQALLMKFDDSSLSNEALADQACKVIRRAPICR